MPSNISFNPALVSNAAGYFDVESTGYVQGVAEDDPAVRFALAGGILSTSETLPMWGGVAIYEDVPPSSSNVLGSIVGRATAVSTGTKQITGWSVFNQNHAWITTPQSECPSGAAGMQVNFYRLGSYARIPVQMDPNLVDLAGGLTTQQVSWDFLNQQLVPYVSVSASSGTYASTNYTISSGTYNPITGTVSLTLATSPNIQAGDEFTLSGLTGTGSYASLNGSYTAAAGTSGTTIVFTATTGLALTLTGGTLAVGLVTLTTASAHGLLPGDTFVVSGATAGTGSYASINGENSATIGTTGTTLKYTIASGLTMTINTATVSNGAALPVRILKFRPNNCKVVSYDPINNLVHWNNNGAAAVILI